MLNSIEINIKSLTSFLNFRYELVFEAVVQGLQSKRYLVEKGAKEYTATKKIDLAKSGNNFKFYRYYNLTVGITKNL